MRWAVGCLVGVLTLACGPSRLIGENYDANDDDGSTGSSGAPPSSSGDSSSGGSSSGGSSSGGSSSGGDDGTTGDTETDTGGAFIAEPDGGGLGQCDPTVQNCANPGEKCTAYVTEPGYCCVDANKCVPVIGHKKPGDLCTRFEDNDDCDKGSFCMPKTTSGGTGDGICMEFCVLNHPEICPSGGECRISGDGVLPLCLHHCNPLLQDCPEHMACYATFDEFVCILPGNEGDEGNDGDACYAIHSCMPGLVCVSADRTSDCQDGDACCTPFCDLAAADPNAPCDVAGGESCQPWYEPGYGPPGLENVGACVLPS